MQQIGISFKYDFVVKEYIKRFRDVKWSLNHKTFYLPFSKENTNAFYTYLRAADYVVDYHSLLKLDEKGKKFILKPLKPHFEIAIKQFVSWMRQKRYSKNTIKTYESMIILFFRFHDSKEIDAITNYDIELFNTEYILKNNYSYTFQNQLVNAIKLFYSQTTSKKLIIETLDRPKKDKRLPEVLSLDEIKLLLTSINNMKHKTLLSLLYSCGLRIGEALNIELTNIDFNRRLLHIKSGKGRKDRYIPLSETMLVLLKKYYEQYRPKWYVFEGQKGGKYTAVSARQVLKRALWQTDIVKHVTLHTLRHSYATHLLENGTDIRFIQELLGHNNPKTTMIYTHISTTSLEKIKNPFDDFDI